MDPLRSPFPQGTTTAHRPLVGRDGHIRQLNRYVDSLFDGDHSPIPHVRGELGIGKTALCRHLQRQLENRPCPVVYIELGAHADLLYQFSRRLPGVVRDALGRRPGSMTSRLGSLLKRVSVNINALGGIGLGVGPATDAIIDEDYDRVQAIGDLVEEVAEALALPTFFVIDEVGLATEADGIRLLELRDLVRDRELPFGFVLVGNYAITALGRRSYAGRLTSEIDVRGIGSDDLADLLESGVNALGGDWTADGIALTATASGGNPWLAGRITNEAWDSRQSSTLTSRDVERAVGTVRTWLGSGVHRHHWEAGSNEVREVLLTLATSNPRSTQELIRQARRDPRTPEADALHQLVTAETICVNWNDACFEFLVPWFDEYVRSVG